MHRERVDRIGQVQHGATLTPGGAFINPAHGLAEARGGE
jgi:hypothetical protein